MGTAPPYRPTIRLRSRLSLAPQVIGTAPPQKQACGELVIRASREPPPAFRLCHVFLHVHVFRLGFTWGGCRRDGGRARSQLVNSLETNTAESDNILLHASDTDELPHHRTAQDSLKRPFGSASLSSTSRIRESHEEFISIIVTLRNHSDILDRERPSPAIDRSSTWIPGPRCYG